MRGEEDKNGNRRADQHIDGIADPEDRNVRMHRAAYHANAGNRRQKDKADNVKLRDADNAPVAAKTATPA
jgi:hypothetical protein